MTVKQKSVGTVKKGDCVVIDGVACRVSSIQVSRPGKHGHAKVRLEAVGLVDQKKRVVIMPGHDNIDVPIIEKMTAQVLSVNNNMANVMDNENYETFDLEIPEELKDKVVDGVIVLYWKVLGEKIMKDIRSGN